MPSVETESVSSQSLEPFLQACGAQGPLQISLTTPGIPEGEDHSVRQPFVLIGRDPQADLPLEDEEISRQHAYLQVLAGRVFCLDLKSRAGTSWDGVRQRSGWIEDGQSVQIGRYQINVRMMGSPAQSEVEPGDPATGPSSLPRTLPDVTFEFRTRSGRTSIWEMTPLLALVGKSPECRIHLVGRSVSNFHCSLVRTPQGVWVVDLLGRGGIRVNDEPVRFARLDNGDRLQVGKFVTRLHYDTMPTGTSGRTSPLERQAPPTPVQSPELVLSPALPRPPDLPAMLPAPDDRASTNGDAAHGSLMPVARQLGLMQQQMFDQFQQAMTMMFQMFSSLQQDQIGVVRQELEHIRKLHEEVHRLQVELLKRPPGTPPSAGTMQSKGPSPSKPGPRTVSPPALRTTPTPKTPASPIKAPGSSEPVAPTAMPSPETADNSMHVWLSDRIAELHQEQQSRWQKIVGYLTGKKGNESTSAG